MPSFDSLQIRYQSFAQRDFYSLGCLFVAEWVRSRMAGSEHSTSKTPGLAERPVSGNLDDRNGHPAAAQIKQG